VMTTPPLCVEVEKLSGPTTVKGKVGTPTSPIFHIPFSLASLNLNIFRYPQSWIVVVVVVVVGVVVVGVAVIVVVYGVVVVVL